MLDCEIVTLWQRKKAITLVFKSRKQIMLVILRLMYRLLFKPKEVGAFIRLYFEEYSITETENWEALFSEEDVIRMKERVAA